MGFKKLGDANHVYYSGPDGGESTDIFDKVESANYLKLVHDTLFHEVNEEFPTGHLATYMNGFSSDKIIVSYFRATGNRHVLHLKV